MLVNLDLLDAVDKTNFPPHELNFILYNPTAKVRSAEVTIPPAKDEKVRLSANGKAVDHILRIPAHGIVRLLAEY